MPFYRFDIHVRLSAPEVRARIESLTDRVDTGPWWVRTTANEFNLRRKSSDPDDDNDFAPRVRGRVNEFPSGCTVLVSMSLPPFVAVFMTAWLCFTGGSALWMASTERRPGGLALMFILGLVITLLGFYLPAWRMRARLVDVLTRNG
jgi:hypothetical protein